MKCTHSHAIVCQLTVVLTVLFASTHAISQAANPRPIDSPAIAPLPLKKGTNPAGGFSELENNGVKEVHVFALQFVDATSTAAVVSKFVDGSAKIAADDRTNSLIISGDAKTIEQIASLIKLLDHGKSAPLPNLTKTYAVKHTAADQDLKELILMVISAEATVAVDQTRNIILLRGNEKSHAAVEKLLERIDQAPPAKKSKSSRRVHITWLASSGERSGDGKTSKPGNATLPATLNPVIAELEKIGVTNLKVAAQTMVRCTTDEKFEILCKADLGTPCDLVIGGLLGSGEDGQPRLMLVLNGRQQRPTAVQNADGGLSGGRGSRQAMHMTEDIVRIETTITAPAGHPVVLGVSPIGKITSVFVVTVFED